MDADAWLQTFSARTFETSALELLLENIGGRLTHPAFPTLCSAIRNAKYLLCGNCYDTSLKWAQVAMDFTWEQLNTGNWKDVSVGWKEMYSIAALLKAANLSKKRQFREALVELDKGVLMGAPVFDNALHSFATALTSKICTEPTSSTDDLPSSNTGNGNATDTQAASDLVASQKPRKVVFKNYKQFQTRSNVQQQSFEDRSSLEPQYTLPETKKLKMNKSAIVKQATPEHPAKLASSIPLLDPSHRVPVVHCPSLETFHQQYMEMATPTVITGAMDHWPAYSARKWRLDYYCQRVLINSLVHTLCLTT